MTDRPTPEADWEREQAPMTANRPDTAAIRAVAAWLKERRPSYSAHRQNLYAAAHFIDEHADWIDAQSPASPEPEAGEKSPAWMRGNDIATALRTLADDGVAASRTYYWQGRTERVPTILSVAANEIDVLRAAAPASPEPGEADGCSRSGGCPYPTHCARWGKCGPSARSAPAPDGEPAPNLGSRSRVSGSVRGDAVDGGTVWFWSEAAADAFIAQVNTEPEQLPDGVYRSQDAFFMVRHWWDDVPPGWRRRHDAHPEHECFAVERVPSVPATERVPVLQAIEQKRTAVAPDGSHMPLTDDVIVHRVKGRWSLMYDDAGHAFERRPVADADGTVEVLRQDTEAQS